MHFFYGGTINDPSAPGVPIYSFDASTYIKYLCNIILYKI